jgi:hypothetical protein
MKQPSMTDRRRTKRRSLSYYLLIKDATTNETIGHLIDITPDGFMMDCPKPLALEKDFRFRLDTSPDVSDKSYIVFTARSKWRKPDVIEPYLFDIGFSIVDIQQHDSAIIARIAEKYAAQEAYNFSRKY